MSPFTRDEIEAMISKYKRVAREAGRTGNWDAWAELFTEDATYVEHELGVFGGRDAIRTWITNTMSEYPASEMRFYPWEWYIIDEYRGWVVAKIWNRMSDPGDGSVHQAYNFTLFEYAGDGMWSLEEDIYNPRHFTEMLQGWPSRNSSRAPDLHPELGCSVPRFRVEEAIMFNSLRRGDADASIGSYEISGGVSPVAPHETLDLIEDLKPWPRPLSDETNKRVIFPAEMRHKATGERGRLRAATEALMKTARLAEVEAFLIRTTKLPVVNIPCRLQPLGWTHK